MMDHKDSKLQLISEEAAEWFVRIKDRDLDSTGQHEYVKWLKQSPLHVAEFLRVSQNYLRYRRAELPAFEPAESAESNVFELRLREIELSEPKSKRPPVATWKIAATVATVACSLLFGSLVKVAWFDRTIETGAGEWRQVALTDGSTMRVGPLTDVRIEFSDQHRTINLLQGQAFFQVAKDKRRPFFVNSGVATVRAVGTQFAVSRASSDVVVTVSEGTVAVTRGKPPATPGTLAQNQNGMPSSVAEIPVSADEQVKVSPRAWPTKVNKVNSTRELAWTRQQLMFDTETLAEAAAAFNRLNRVQISVDDAEIAQWRVCCVFDATDPESFAQSMAEESGIGLVHDPFGVLHLVAESEMDEDAVQENVTIQAEAH